MRHLNFWVVGALFWFVFSLLTGALPANPPVYAFFDNGEMLIQPEADFDPVMPGCGNYTVFIENLSSGNPTTAEWFAPGATPSYSTEYHPTLSYPGPGTYTVTLVVSNADGADTSSQAFTLYGSAVGYFTQSICQDQWVEVAGEIFDADNPGGAVLLPGASAGGCDSTVFVTLFVLPTAQINLDETIPAGGSYTFCGQTLNNSGIYFCSQQSSQGCDTLFILHLSIAVGTGEAQDGPDAWTAAPNPFMDQITVRWPEAAGEAGTLELRNATGALVHRHEVAKGQNRADIATGRLPAGVYGLLWRSSGKAHWRKVVKL